MHHPSCCSMTCGCLSIPHPTASHCILVVSSYSLCVFASPFLSQTPSRKHVSHQCFLLSPQLVQCQAAVFYGSRGKPRLHGAEVSKLAGKGDQQCSSQYSHTTRSQLYMLKWGDAPFAADQHSDLSPCRQRGRRMLPLPKPRFLLSQHAI